MLAVAEHVWLVAVVLFGQHPAEPFEPPVRVAGLTECFAFASYHWFFCWQCFANSAVGLEMLALVEVDPSALVEPVSLDPAALYERNFVVPFERHCFEPVVELDELLLVGFVSLVPVENGDPVLDELDATGRAEPFVSLESYPFQIPWIANFPDSERDVHVGYRGAASELPIDAIVLSRFSNVPVHAPSSTEYSAFESYHWNASRIYFVRDVPGACAHAATQRDAPFYVARYVILLAQLCGVSLIFAFVEHVCDGRRQTLVGVVRRVSGDLCKCERSLTCECSPCRVRGFHIDAECFECAGTEPCTLGADGSHDC